MNEKKNTTTIRVSKETHKILTDMGKKGQTYDEVIKKAIEHNKRIIELSEETIENLRNWIIYEGVKKGIKNINDAVEYLLKEYMIESAEQEEE